MTFIEIIQKVQPIILVVFVYATMIYLGLSMTVKQIWQQAKRLKPVITAVVLNIVITPLLASLVGQLFALAAPAFTAVVLINLFGGAPAGPKNVDLADGDRPLSISVVIVVSLAVLIIVPFSSKLFFSDIQGGAGLILRNLITLILIPLSIGLLVRAFLPKVIKPLQRIESILSNIFMILVILTFIIPNFSAIISVGIKPILVYIVIILLSFGVSFALTFGSMAERKTVSLITITKNFGIALSLAPATFTDMDLIPYIMCYIVLLLLISLPLSLLLKRLHGKKQPANQPQDAPATVSK